MKAGKSADPDQWDQVKLMTMAVMMMMMMIRKWEKEHYSSVSRIIFLGPPLVKSDGTFREMCGVPNYASIGLSGALNRSSFGSCNQYAEN